MHWILNVLSPYSGQASPHQSFFRKMTESDGIIFLLEAPSLFPNYFSLFQVDKKLTSTSPSSQSHTLLGWYTTLHEQPAQSQSQLTPTIETIYRRNWSYLSGLQPIFLFKADPSQFIFREINIILEINLCPCFLRTCIFIAGSPKHAHTFMFVLFAAHDLKWHTEVLQNGFAVALKSPPLLNRIHLLETFIGSIYLMPFNNAIKHKWRKIKANERTWRMSVLAKKNTRACSCNHWEIKSGGSLGLYC